MLAAPLDRAARAPETMIHMDPPEHRRFRELLTRRFTPRAMRAIEADVAVLARDIVDELAARGPEGECNFVEQIAAHLPLAVIAWRLDLPRGDWADLYHWRMPSSALRIPTTTSRARARTRLACAPRPEARAARDAPRARHALPRARSGHRVTIAGDKPR